MEGGCAVHAYVLACYRYIELNPVRAGMVTRPEDCRWTSLTPCHGRHPAQSGEISGLAGKLLEQLALRAFRRGAACFPSLIMSVAVHVPCLAIVLQVNF